MKSILKLFFCDLKTFVRDKQALFWTILFPIMFVVIFGLIDFGKMGTSHLSVIDQVKSDESSSFVEELKKIEILRIHQDEPNVTKTKESLEKEDLDFILIIPESFKRPKKGKFPVRGNLQRTKEIPQGLSIPIEVYYDETNAQLTPLIDALRKISIEGSHLFDLGKQLLFLRAWFFVLLIVAIKTFRFKEE